MTTTPSIGILASARRMASTAAPSAVFLSPRPLQRALASAPASVTRTSSRARLRLISADTPSAARSGRAINCYACGVPAWHPRTYFSWAAAGGEGIGDHESAAGHGSLLDPMGTDPRHPGRDADVPDLSADGRLLAADGHRPLPAQIHQRRRGLRLQPQQRTGCRGDAASPPQPFPIPRLRGCGRGLDLQAQVGRDADRTLDQHLSDPARRRSATGAGSTEATSRPSLVGRDLSRGHAVAHGQYWNLQEGRSDPGDRRRSANRAGLYRWSVRGLPPLSPHPPTTRGQHQIRGPALPATGRGLRQFHCPGRASGPNTRRPQGPFAARAGANRLVFSRGLELLVLTPLS